MSANKTLLLLLSAFAVLSFSGALYMYNEYRVLDQNHQAIQENIDNDLDDQRCYHIVPASSRPEVVNVRVKITVTSVILCSCCCYTCIIETCSV